MRVNSNIGCWLLVPVIAMGLIANFATAQDTESTTVATTETTVGCPATAEVTYSLYSDYIFRGINFSEYFGEGREKPNHQITTSLGIDVGALVGTEPGTCGIFQFDTFFEWFAAQKQLDPVSGGQNWQEVDYTLSWAYDIEPISSTLTLGWTFYAFPNAKQNNTNEWFVSIDHNDAWMWKWLYPDNEDGVLNPSLALYHDIDVGAGDAAWVEFGLSHEFEVADDLTITPSWTLGIDHTYYHYFAGDPDDSTTRFANMLWGLDVTYDITELVRFPEKWGSVALSGFVFFSDALGNSEDNHIIQDEFFGGMSIGWSFGG